jgi:hypothetical protein
LEQPFHLKGRKTNLDDFSIVFVFNFLQGNFELPLFVDCCGIISQISTDCEERSMFSRPWTIDGKNSTVDEKEDEQSMQMRKKKDLSLKHFLLRFQFLP